MKAAFPGQSLKGHMQASDTVPLEVMETGACCVWYRGLCGKEVCVVQRSVWYRGLCGTEVCVVKDFCPQTGMCVPMLFFHLYACMYLCCS